MNEIITLSDRIKYLLKLFGITQSELARRISIKPQVIQYLCSGKVTKSKFLFDIAEVLNIDPSWLINGTGSPPSEHKKNQCSIPILSLNQIIEWIISRKKNDFSKVTEWIPIGDRDNKESFGVVLTDKSMAPRFEIDTVIIIDPITGDLNLNKFVLVYLVESNFIVFRQLINEKNVKILKPFNTCLYKETILGEKDIILGVCKEARWVI